MDATSSALATDALRVRWAAERTLLAWVRTTLALFGLGFVVARFVTTVGASGGVGTSSARYLVSWTPAALGIAFVVLGVVVMAAAGRSYRAVLRDLGGAGRLPPGSAVPMVTSALVSALGVGLAIALTLASA